MKNKLKRAIALFRSKYTCINWQIGLVKHSDAILSARDMPQVKWLKHDFQEGWFADPFIVSEDAEHYVIWVETWRHGSDKGVLGEIVATKRDFRMVSYRDILARDTHLSFPCYFRKGEKIYVYPENSASGGCALYSYDPQQHSLNYERLLCDKALCDATIIPGHEEFMLATEACDGNGNRCLVLRRNESGSYVIALEIHLKDETARGAGLPFKMEDGTLIRPAQNCHGGYGIGLVMQELIVEKGQVSIKEVNRLYPNDKKLNRGLHTYNRFGEVAIVDGYGDASPFMLFIDHYIIHPLLLFLSKRVGKPRL